MSKSRVIFTFLLSIFLLAGFSMLAVAKESNRDNVKIIDGFKATKGKLCPRFELKTLDGTIINSEDLRGKKCLVMNFWATWCGPCTKEMPYLQKFHDKYKDTCEVISVSKDMEKSHVLLENKIKEMKVTYPVVHDSGDKLRTTLFPSKGIPFLVVLNKKGEVVALKYGSVEPNKVAADLEKLLGDDLKSPAKEEPKETVKSDKK
jgi:peroxiredoxin